MEFEWNFRKTEHNLRKHGVSFAEAATVFDDPLGATAYDIDHSAEENRFITVGRSKRSRLIIVSHADRGDRVRIISARRLTKSEREAYEEETGK